jgi:pyruvate dehydrogenase E2 component (dihydrolipoamide acetyltransferase)
MHASLHEMAQLTLTMDVVMDAVVRHRSAADPSRRAGFTDYVVAAVAGALVEHPVINSQITDGQVAVLPEINVGLAVALDGGLVVPVVHRTDTLTFDALRAETTRLAEAARNGRLTREEVDGATFSITALGMHGVDAFTPVINPPNTAILGVGRLRDGVRWDGDTPVRTTLLTLSLTWDHRAYDGVPAADFTASVRNRLEAWASP